MKGWVQVPILLGPASCINIKMHRRVKFLRYPVDPAKRAASLRLLKEAVNKTDPAYFREMDQSKCQLFSYPGELELERELEKEATKVA